MPAASGVPQGSLLGPVGQSVPSASLLMTQNWKERPIHQKAVLPFSEIWRGWRFGCRGT